MEGSSRAKGRARPYRAANHLDALSPSGRAGRTRGFPTGQESVRAVGPYGLRRGRAAVQKGRASGKIFFFPPGAGEKQVAGSGTEHPPPGKAWRGFDIGGTSGEVIPAVRTARINLAARRTSVESTLMERAQTLGSWGMSGNTQDVRQ